MIPSLPTNHHPCHLRWLAARPVQTRIPLINSGPAALPITLAQPASRPFTSTYSFLRKNKPIPPIVAALQQPPQPRVKIPIARPPHD
jgi:hypothetical protein